MPVASIRAGTTAYSEKAGQHARTQAKDGKHRKVITVQRHGDIAVTSALTEHQRADYQHQQCEREQEPLPVQHLAKG